VKGSRIIVGNIYLWTWRSVLLHFSSFLEFYNIVRHTESISNETRCALEFDGHTPSPSPIQSWNLTTICWRT